MSNFFNLLSVLTIMSLSIGKLSAVNSVNSSLKANEFKKSYNTFVGVLLLINSLDKHSPVLYSISTISILGGKTTLMFVGIAPQFDIPKSRKVTPFGTIIVSLESSSKHKAAQVLLNTQRFGETSFTRSQKQST